MASGKKNYFRHSTSAFEDEKIQKCIQLLGYEGYAYYFILIELLAKQCENSFKNPITLHQQSLRIVWRKQEQSCQRVVKKLQESGLFVATFRESFIDFDIPNLEKYMGFYSTKIEPNAPKESKRKEKKVKEKKEKETKINSLPETTSVREFYLESYFSRYGLKPVWAAKESSLAKKLIASIGKNEAEHLAKAYPFFNDPWHVKQKHPFGLLVSQLDKVRVELANPERMMDEKRASRELSDYELKRNNLRALGLEE
jgi:hypothetical protein